MIVYVLWYTKIGSLWLWHLSRVYKYYENSVNFPSSGILFYILDALCIFFMYKLDLFECSCMSVHCCYTRRWLTPRRPGPTEPTSCTSEKPIPMYLLQDPEPIVRGENMECSTAVRIIIYCKRNNIYQRIKHIIWLVGVFFSEKIK